MTTKTDILTPDQAAHEIRLNHKLPRGTTVDGNLKVVSMKRMDQEIDLENITVNGNVFLGTRENPTVMGDVLMSDVIVNSVILPSDHNLSGSLVLNRAELGEEIDDWETCLYLSGHLKGGLHVPGTVLNGTVDISTQTGPGYIKVHSEYAERIHRAAPTVPLVEVGAFSDDK
jgi:hypothetical protein